MPEKISENIYRIGKDSNVYLIYSDFPIIIDTGEEEYREYIKDEIESICPCDDIKAVILTHLHYDHSGNVSIFPKATFYASTEAIKCHQNMPVETVFVWDSNREDYFKNITLIPIPSEFHGLKVLLTPGHTRGSICLYLTSKKILFSGDTLFFRGEGRIDLPTSEPDKIEKSLQKIAELDYETLCPGHDYGRSS
jgi:hydroxyacylglutathione hydrolase